MLVVAQLLVYYYHYHRYKYSYTTVSAYLYLVDAINHSNCHKSWGASIMNLHRFHVIIDFTYPKCICQWIRRKLSTSTGMKQIIIHMNPFFCLSTIIQSVIYKDVVLKPYLAAC